MEITIKTTDLTGALEVLSKIIPAKPVHAVLLGTHMSLGKDGRITLTAGDGDTFIRTELQTESSTGQGCVMLNTRVLYDLLKTIADETVTLSFDDNLRCTLKWLTGKADITASGSADDYPVTEKMPQEAVTVTPDETELLSALSHTLYAVANDPIRPFMCGLRLEIGEERTTFACTDSHRLASYVLNAGAAGPGSAIVPSRPAAIIKGLLRKNTDEKAAITTDGRLVSITAGGYCLTTHSIPGKFPDWRAILPKDNGNILTVDKDYLLSAMRRATAVTSAAFKTIVFHLVQDGTCTISTEDKGYMTESRESLTDAQYAGEEITVAFKHDHVRDVLSTLSCDTVHLMLKDGRRAALLLPEDPDGEEPCTTLLMPIYIKN